MRIKIGLLLDSFSIPVWQERIVTFIDSHPQLSLDLIVFYSAPRKRSNRKRLVYKSLIRFDRAAFRVKEDMFRRVDIREMLPEVMTVNAESRQVKFTTEMSPSTVNEVKERNLDVLLRFGSGILKGGILKAAKYGIWSLHHGDNAVNRGGPPGFWEVVNKDSVTGVTLQVLSEQLDAGHVLGKAFIKTDFSSFYRNTSNIFLAGIELFCSTLVKLSSGQIDFSSERASHGLNHYSHPLYKDPDNARSFLIVLSYLIRIAKNACHKVLFRQQWIINLRAGNATALFQFKSIKPPALTDWADPFVIDHDGKYFVFIEEKFAGHKAHISYLPIDSNGKLISDKAVPVIKELYHLSYPHILSFDGNYYMIPEAAESGEVWLYKCTSFPAEWKKTKRLLSQALYDPTLFRHEGSWYLMGTQRPLEQSSPNQYLYIYYSKDLFTDTWTLHPMSPVTRDVRGARPAGKIFMSEGRLFRPSQICAPKYGYGIRFNEIEKLSPVEYRENPVHEILPLWNKNLLATHTFNFATGLTAVDAQVRVRRFFN